MHEAVGQVAVVGQEQQALGHVVEPPDVCQPRRVIHQIEDGFSAARVGPGRHDARGFVQHDPDGRSGSDNLFAVDANLVAFRVDALTDLGDAAVDGDTTSRNEILGVAPRRNTGPGKRTLEPHFGHSSSR